MVKKSEERWEKSGEKRDLFKIWADSYAAVSKIWEDSCVNIYKPWIESTGEMFDKAVELSKEATPEKYKEFYDEWMKTYQNTFGRFYPFPQKSDREALEKLVASAEESSDLFKSWIAELEEKSQKTQEMFRGAPDPEKYREYYDMWMKSYEKIFDEFLAMPTMKSTKEIFEYYSGIPNIYLRNFAQMSKLWKDSYKLCLPWMESMSKLSGKTVEISRGEASPEAYKEFYNLWMDTYREIYGRLFSVESLRPSKEMLDSFLKSTDIYLSMYKSWIAALEKMSEKTAELSKRTAEPEAYKEFYSTWVKMNERAFEDFFKYMPAVGPMKSMIEPVKNAAKVYTDMFVNISNAWMRMVPSATSKA